MKSDDTSEKSPGRIHAQNCGSVSECRPCKRLRKKFDQIEKGEQTDAEMQGEVRELAMKSDHQRRRREWFTPPNDESDAWERRLAGAGGGRQEHEGL